MDHLKIPFKKLAGVISSRLWVEMIDFSIDTTKALIREAWITGQVLFFIKLNGHVMGP